MELTTFCNSFYHVSTWIARVEGSGCSVASVEDELLDSVGEGGYSTVVFHVSLF